MVVDHGARGVHAAPTRQPRRIRESECGEATTSAQTADVPALDGQLQALEASPSHPVVRLPIGETWMIKQVLDIGAQNVLVPMVESADVS